MIRLFERDIFPWIGGRPVAEVTAAELLTAIRRIETRGALETAHRARTNCGQVFAMLWRPDAASVTHLAICEARCPLSRENTLRLRQNHRNSRESCVRWMDIEGDLTVRCALRLAPLVFVRPGELRMAEWKDVDLDAAEWRYTVTKTDIQHIVPLSRQAVKILRELQPLTGDGQFLFPGARTNKRPMSDNAVLAAMRRMGIGKEEMTGHGFRAVARTILDEVLGFRPDFIEHQLAHAVRDPLGRAYNRTAHLPERRKMMQKWADYLDKLKSGAAIVAMDQKA